METDDSLVTITLSRKAVRYINDRLAHDREVRARDRENKRKSRPHIDKPKTGPKNGPFIKDEVIAIEIPPPVPQTPIILPRPVTPGPVQPVILSILSSPPIVPIPADTPIPVNIPESLPNPDIPNPPFSPIIMPIPASSPIPSNEIVTIEPPQPSTCNIEHRPILVSFKQSPPPSPSPLPPPPPKQPQLVKVPTAKIKPPTATQFPVQIPAIKDTSIWGLLGGILNR